MVLSEGTTEKIPSDTTGNRSQDRPTALPQALQRYRYKTEMEASGELHAMATLSRGRINQNLLKRRLGRPHNRFGRLGKEKSFLFLQESNYNLGHWFEIHLIHERTLFSMRYVTVSPATDDVTFG